MLCKSRNDPSYWCQNIIDSEKLATSEKELKHFYMYIMNPHTYDPTLIKNVVTLGDLEKQGKLVDDIKPYPPGYETRVYENGDEIILDIRNNSHLGVVNEEDDEKKENV